MDIGVALPQFDHHADRFPPWATTVAWATRAEELGFASVWLADHLFLSLEKYGGQPGRHPGLDPLVALPALARHTERVSLGSLVLCTQLRPPTVLAKALTTIDILSNGRLIAGMGAGWYEPEYRAAGVPFEGASTRLAQLGEAVDVLRGMFTDDPFSYAGRHYTAAGARCLPKPAQRDGPPIWVGGKGDKVIETAVQHADGWNTAWVWSPDAYRERLGVLGQACENAGRDPATVTLSVGLSALVGEDEADLRRRWERLVSQAPPGVLATPFAEWRRGRLVGTVEQVREQVAVWEGLGVSTLVVALGALPFSVTNLDDLDCAASAVL